MYAITSTYDDEKVEKFYENVEVAMKLHKFSVFFHNR